MANEINIVERAFELARSGKCHSIQDMIKTLKRERFESVDAHFSSKTLKLQLRTAMQQKAAENAS